MTWDMPWREKLATETTREVVDEMREQFNMHAPPLYSVLEGPQGPMGAVKLHDQTLQTLADRIAAASKRDAHALRVLVCRLADRLRRYHLVGREERRLLREVDEVLCEEVRS